MRSTFKWNVILINCARLLFVLHLKFRLRRDSGKYLPWRLFYRIIISVQNEVYRQILLNVHFIWIFIKTCQSLCLILHFMVMLDRNLNFRQNYDYQTNVIFSILLETLPDALNNGCNSCTDLQKRNSRKVIHHLQDRKPKEWRQLLDKYDPEGTYKKNYEKHIKGN